MLVTRKFIAAALMAASLGGVAIAQSRELVQQTLYAALEQKSDNAAKPDVDSERYTRHADQAAPIGYQKSSSEGANLPADDEATKHAPEDSEFWMILGHRLKITDTLLSIFTFLLILVGGGQGIVLYRTDKSTHKAADAAETAANVAEKALLVANQPWVKVDIQVGGPVFYNVNGVNFPIKYILKNIGNSPATNVWVTPRVIVPIPSVPGVKHFDPRSELRNDITALKKNPGRPWGHTLFPDETIIHEITVTLSQEKVTRATELIKAINPTIIGAVSYRMGFDDKTHLTGFIFEIQRSSTPWPKAIFIDEGDVPATEVRLCRSFIDGGYAD